MGVIGENNKISVGDNVALALNVSGNNNVIDIGNSRVSSSISIFINGDNNNIFIGDSYQVKGLSIYCGNHVKADNTSVIIGKDFSIEPGCSFLLYNSGNMLTVGGDCLFSNGITIRCGESPHLIFDSQTGAYLDVSHSVSIGKHVWLGERAYITKRAAVPNNCIVAACSVVTRRFEEENCVLGGNPSKIVKRNIHWVRNSDFLGRDNLYRDGFDSYIKSKNPTST